jgi:hypothetical protein
MDKYEPWPFEQTLSHDALACLATAIELHLKEPAFCYMPDVQCELENTANAIRGFLQRQVDPLLL